MIEHIEAAPTPGIKGYTLSLLANKTRTNWGYRLTKSGKTIGFMPVGSYITKTRAEDEGRIFLVSSLNAAGITSAKK